MEQTNQPPRARQQKGIGSGGRIAMYLSDAERRHLIQLAEQECRSAASMARVIYLRGLQAVTES
ncbi:hypothetical protein [Edwardsiella ictaluri]|uniref:hypothetical protein n=1 Tax=Edwardsiella ictaluri TaxID=67780 RepID=UPI0039F6D09C